MEITKTMQELKDEATALGLDFSGMKSKAEVNQLIEDHYESQAAGDFVQVAQETETKIEEKPVRGGNPMVMLAKRLKDNALKKRVVRITSNDKRENHLTTTAFLSCDNQYFSLSKIVPLDVPVQLEQGLIDTAKDIEIVLHVTDSKTGMTTPKLVKKYVISYEDIK